MTVSVFSRLRLTLFTALGWTGYGRDAAHRVDRLRVLLMCELLKSFERTLATLFLYRPFSLAKSAHFAGL